MPPAPLAEASPKRGPTWPLVAALIAGAALFAASPDVAQHRAYLVAALLAALTFIPPVHRAIGRGCSAVRVASTDRGWLPPLVLFVTAAIYFAFSAIHAQRRLAPSYHDEYMYQLQAQLLARGRLWLPAHPLGEFFDAFFVLTTPVYTSAYFPGAALLYVPGVWLGLEPWLTSVAIAAGTVALVYVVIADLVDPLAGWAAAFLAVAVQQLRVLSVMTMSHTALLLLVLATTWAYLRWRGARATGWAVAVGALAGWSAVTRPLDAACLILPIGLAMLWDLRPAGARATARTLAVLVAAAAPFLLLQLVFNKGVTGRWTDFPIAEFNRRNFPGAADAKPVNLIAAESPSHLPQFRDYYRVFIRPTLQDAMPGGLARTWLVGRVAPMAHAALPYHLLYVLLPVGLLALRRSPALPAITAGAILMPLAYAFWAFFLNHYALAVVPAFLLLAMLGVDVLRRRWPALEPPLLVGLIALAIAALPELRGQPDPHLQAPFLDDIDARIAQIERRPAVVLFHYASGKVNPNLVHYEPVYNVDTAWPDDAEVVRAHDLGPAKNRRIFEYYAKQDPQRFFYLYDRTTADFRPLGFARDLAAAAPATSQESDR